MLPFKESRIKIQNQIMQVPFRNKEIELVILTVAILFPSGYFFFLFLRNFNCEFQVAYSQESQQLQVTCVTYDSTEDVIRIRCNNSTLTYIDNQLQNPDLFTEGIC